MKKYIFAFCIFVIAIALIFSAPRVYERYISIDREAATALKKLPVEEVGKVVVDCMNRKNRSTVWWDWNTANDLEAHEGRGGKAWPSYSAVSGRHGWHLTWMATISIEPDRVIAYDSFGAKNGGSHVLFHRALPTRIVGSLKRCGVAYAGVLPEDVLIFLTSD